MTLKESDQRMLIDVGHEIRVAVVSHDGKLLSLDEELPGQEQKKSNIYKGIISTIEPSLGAVFVDYADKHGFLPFKEIAPEYYTTPCEHPESISDIRQFLREGQTLIVQVEKEERGNKGAVLSTFISLPGSYLVLMPNSPHVEGISRRIEGEERDQARKIASALPVPEGMGVIVRTAGIGRSQAELEWDLGILLNYWEAIQKAYKAKEGPCLICQEIDTVTRTIRDKLRDMTEIIINDEETYQRVFNYIHQIQPESVNRLRLYKDTIPLFSRFYIEHQIEMAHQRSVVLPSGASIVIESTEAMTTIDVNSGRATKTKDIEDTAFQRNLEAAKEIGKQVLLRDLGGLIVIDFIDMRSSEHCKQVEDCLRQALQNDRARVRLGRISKFGLLEMSRQRTRSSLAQTHRSACPCCSGQGTVRSVESQAMALVRLLQEQSQINETHVQLHVSLELCTVLMNEHRIAIAEIERLCRTHIVILPDLFLQNSQYILKSTKTDGHHAAHNGLRSQQLFRTLYGRSLEAQKNHTHSSDIPAIHQFLNHKTEHKESDEKLLPDQSWIQSLWNRLFGSKSCKNKTHETQTATDSFIADASVSESKKNESLESRAGRNRLHRNKKNPVKNNSEATHTERKNTSGRTQTRTRRPVSTPVAESSTAKHNESSE